MALNRKAIAAIAVAAVLVFGGYLWVGTQAHSYTTPIQAPQNLGTLYLDVWLNFTDGSTPYHLSSQGTVSLPGSTVQYQGKDVQYVTIQVGADLNQSIEVKSMMLTLTIGVNPASGGDTVTVAQPTSTSLPFTYVLDAANLQAGEVVLYPSLTLTANAVIGTSSVLAKYVSGIQPVAFNLTVPSTVDPQPTADYVVFSNPGGDRFEVVLPLDATSAQLNSAINTYRAEGYIYLFIANIDPGYTTTPPPVAPVSATYPYGLPSSITVSVNGQAGPSSLVDYCTAEAFFKVQAASGLPALYTTSAASESQVTAVIGYSSWTVFQLASGGTVYVSPDLRYPAVGYATCGPA